MDNDVCPWCDEFIRLGQPSVAIDDKPYHLHCAAEEEENAFFDRDMDFD